MNEKKDKIATICVPMNPSKKKNQMNNLAKIQMKKYLMRIKCTFRQKKN